MNFERVADIIQDKGELVTLRRFAPGGIIHFDCDVWAVVRGFRENELIGGITQGDRSVLISNREISAAQWPGPPREKDQVIIRGKTAAVQTNADTVVVDGVTVSHRMQVRGG